jgi:tetratricopeptide (TPR) repeat protein
MRNLYFFITFFLLAASPLYAQQVPPASPKPEAAKEKPANPKTPVSPYVQALRAGVIAARNNDCDKAITILQPLIEARETFAGINKGGRYTVLSGLYLCAEKKENYPLQYFISKPLIPLLDKPEALLLHRLNLAVYYKEADEALETFRSIYRNTPDRFSDYDVRMYWQLLNQLAREDRISDRLEVLEDLHAAHYTSPIATESAAGFTYELVLALSDVGRQDEAIALLDEVRGVKKILTLMVDNRYSALRKSLAQKGRISLLEEARAELERYRKIAHDNPKSLEAVLRLAQSLRALDQPEAALKSIKAALIRQKQNPDPFTDSKKYLPWLINEQAYAFYQSGKIGEGHKALEAAANLSEEGSSNVSQTINRAEKLIAYGSPQKALALMREIPLDNASAYGKMWVYANRVCAQAFLEGTPISVLDMLFLRTNKKENLAALQNALICADKEDEAAALYIERLEDVKTRSAALLALQKYNPQNGLSAYYTTIFQRQANIRARKDVQAQIKKVGRIQRVHLNSTYWGGI